ncbi:MAG TPA: hypothetical protein ENJ18_10465 [Nannocystis exedens]|nr:hypothetical protein [Nannocystis exedens]
MSRLFKLLALLLVFALTPGGAEIVENAVHLATDGHTAHSVDDAAHAPKGDEHGCSGAMHVCTCHSSASFLVAEVGVSIPPPSIDELSLVRADEGRAMPGYVTGVYRPPAA